MTDEERQARLRDAEAIRDELQDVLQRLHNGFVGQLAPHILLRAMTEFWLTIVTEQVEHGTAAVADAIMLLNALHERVLALPVTTVPPSTLQH